jgi:predicted TIM-barrel fold metal-dependent hydrolase
MIVDVHTHPPTHREAVPESERQPNAMWRPDRVVEGAVSWADYLNAMEPVDKACVFAIQYKGGVEPSGRRGSGLSYGQGNVNDQTAEFARAHPDKLIGFMSVHPEDDDAVEEMERCVHQLGMKGMKLGPNYQNFDPLGEPAFRVFEAAQRMGLPIVFHQGTSPMRTAPIRYAHPLVMDEVAIAFPELRIVMAHLGHPWHIDTFAVIRKHPHVYADVSANFYRPYQQYHGLRLATEWNVLEKLVFGSDYPVATPQETIDGLLAVNAIAENAGLPPVPEDALHRIINRDTLELLGISA